MPRNNPPLRKVRLSQAVVTTAKHEGTSDRSRIYDTECRGLYLVVHQSGRRMFYVAFRVSGRLRRHSLGELGDITLHQARERAHEIRGAARGGVDPIAQRKHARDRMAVSLADFWPRYREQAATGWKPTTARLHDWLWTKCIAPGLGDKPMAGLTVGDVEAWVRELARRRAGNARIALRLLRAMLNYAVSIEAAPGNPAKRVKSIKETKRERFLSRLEIRRLLEAIAAEEAMGGAQGGAPGVERGITPHTAALFRLLMLTGARLREVMAARWDWVNWGGRCLELPDSKTGAKRVPLSSHAIGELRRLEAIRTKGHDWIIEGRVAGRPLTNAQDSWERVRRRAELPGVRLHDLRHSFASLGVEMGMGLPIIGKALGHTQVSTTQRYAHLDADPVLAASERIGAEIMACSVVVPAEVVPVGKACEDEAGEVRGKSGRG